MGKITYEDKEDLVNLPNIQVKNKVTAADMNEIKSCMNYNYDRLVTAEQAIKDLQYIKIAINSFKLTPSIVEIGSTVNDLLFEWALNNAVVKKQVLNGTEIDNSIKSIRYTNLGLRQNKTYTLQVTDDRNAVSSKSATLNFYNGIYYGVASIPTEINSSFILGLTKSLANSRTTKFTVNVIENKYAWFAIPSRFGTPTFTVGGFSGGFTSGESISFTNASGYTEAYTIYRSVNPNLGNITVNVG